MDIPLSEENDLSDDDFDGCIDGESEDEDGDGDCGGCDDGSGNDSINGGDGHDSDNGSDGGVEILEYRWHPCCPQDMANIWTSSNYLSLMPCVKLLLFAQQFIDSHDLARHSGVRQWERSPHVIW